jgi:hypothetical protein
MTTAATSRAVFDRSCWLSAKALGVASRSNTTAAASSSIIAGRRLALLGAGGISVVHPIVVTLCEKKKDDDSILSRDEHGNIDWNAVLENVATMTGEKVMVQRHNNMFLLKLKVECTIHDENTVVLTTLPLCVNCCFCIIYIYI